MLRASLSYNRNSEKINLILSDLRDIDSVTGAFYNIDDFILDSSVWGIMRDYTDGEIIGDNMNLEVVCPDGVRRSVPIIFNDKTSIQISTSSQMSDDSEIEKSRKLLHSSKDKMFLKMFLENGELCETANYEIIITSSEADYITKNKLPIPIINSDRGRRVNMLDVFQVYLTSSKPGMIRKIYDDSLNVWENEISDLSYDEIYYYSRTLRLLSHDYEAAVKGRPPRKELTPIKDLDFVKNLKF